MRIPPQPGDRVSEDAVRFVDGHVHFALEHLHDFTGSFDEVRLCGAWNIVHGSRARGDDLIRLIEATEKRTGGAVQSFFWPDWKGMAEAGWPKRCAGEIARLHKLGIAGVKVWKDLGLGVTDAAGGLVMLDDERLNPIWEKMVELRLILIAHVADPANFWLPLDESNPSYESLKRRPQWHFGKPGLPTREQLFEARDNLHRRFPDLTIVNCHCGGYAESLAQLCTWMDQMPNFHASLNPHHVRQDDPSVAVLLSKHGGRILFETDLGMRRGKKVDLPWNRNMYARAFGGVRELFAPFGRDVLEAFAHLNAERLIRGVRGR